MECNKDEAARAMKIALDKLTAQDWAGAKRFVARAEQLWPKLDGLPQVLAVANVQSRAQTRIGAERDWYEILEVEARADEAVIKRQYKKMALVLHPDKNKFPFAEASFKLIQEASSVLSDKSRREKFDLLKNMANAPTVVHHQFSVHRNHGNFAAQGHGYHPGASIANFWTRCPGCQKQYQYPCTILNQRINCFNCNSQFLATSIGHHPNPVPQSRPRKSTYTFPQNAAAFAAAAAQAGTPGAGDIDPSDLVKRCFNQAKKERQAKAKEEKIAKSRTEQASRGRGRQRKSGVQTRSRKLDEVWSSKNGNEGENESAGVHQKDERVKEQHEKAEKEPAGVRQKDERAKEQHEKAEKESAGDFKDEQVKEQREKAEGEKGEMSSEKGTETHSSAPSKGVEAEPIRCQSNEQDELDGLKKNDLNTEDKKVKFDPSQEVPDSEDDIVLAKMKKKPRKKKLEVPDSEDEEYVNPVSTAKLANGGPSTNNSEPPANGAAATASEKPTNEDKVPVRRSTRKRNITSYNFEEEDDSVEHKKARSSSPDQQPVLDPVPNPAAEQPPPMEQVSGAYDFDADRTLSKVKKGQIWSVYGEGDSLPNWYGLITSVRNTENISIRWLEPVRDNSDDIAKWLESNHFAACGDFNRSRDTTTLSLNMLCSEARAEAVNKNRWKIYPRAGEVWSLIRGWNRSWLTVDKSKTELVHDYAEVLSDFSAEKGVRVVPLVSRDGIFVREAATWQQMGEGDLMRFSHRIPAVRSAAAAGSWQLDPETFSHS